MKINSLASILTILILAGGAMSNAQAQEPVVIQNHSLQLTYQPGSAQFTLSMLAGGHPFALNGRLAGVQGHARKTSISDQTFGRGEAIQISSPDGASGKMMLFPRLPFALVRLTLKNGSATAQTLNRVPLASFDVELGQPAADLKTLGTGGLLPADQNPGSYAWLAVADPRSRRGIVAGWLTHDRASGVLFSKIQGETVQVEARDDYGRLRLLPGNSTDTETLAIGYFDDARLGLEAWADAVARVYHINLPPQPVGFCTWYAEKHGGSSNQKALSDLAGFAAKNLKPFGFDFLQIDDGWQLGDSKGNGPRKNFTDYNPHGPYPSGMKEIAAQIKTHGLTPGIWFMPFAGTYNDPSFQQRQDWFVKRQGTPYDTSWGGTSLDMTNPGARAYLRSLVDHIARQWGFTYFKMDGLYTGIAARQVYVNSGYKEDDLGDATFSDPDKTNIQAFREGLKLVREAAGPEVFFLGCTVTQNMRSYGASFGLVDAMRIGPDNGGDWKRWVSSSPVFGSRNYFLNGRIWYNDPDPNYVRETIPLEEARTIASWPAIAGQFNSNGDWLPDLPADRLEILRRTMPSHGKIARPVDLFENDPPRLWTVSSGQGAARRDLVALFNWADQPAGFNLPLSAFSLPQADQYAAFDFWANRFLPPLKDHLQTTLPPHSCQVLAVRPLVSHPFLLSTSRHISQGMVDLLEEKWDNTGKTLSGKSQVVGGDPYELRVFTPAQPHHWKLVRAEISRADQNAGVQIKFSQSGAEVRAAISSPSSRAVNWRLVFERVWPALFMRVR